MERGRDGVRAAGAHPGSRGARLAWGLVALLGYILSPLSPWNDMVVNVPIALAAAKALKMVAGVNELLGFQIGYAASNMAGLLLLAHGVAGLGAGTRLTGRRLLASLALSTLYSIAAAVALTALGVLSPH